MSCGCGVKETDPRAFSLVCLSCRTVASSHYTSRDACEEDANKMTDRTVKCRGCKSVQWGAIPNTELGATCERPVAGSPGSALAAMAPAVAEIAPAGRGRRGSVSEATTVMRSSQLKPSGPAPMDW
eukprot:c40681_g1_i1.p1 GENE.c40681_g1_i1~~c40681_g1_i1.p1  ORF type:complete len:136 (+),score=7.91 c40681_g1_i1:31-408(+)